MDKELMEDQDAGANPEELQALYAKTLYALRESRKSLLAQYSVADEAELLEKIRCGEASEHPSYEHYLSAQIIDQTREQLRAEVTTRFSGRPPAEMPAISVHMVLQEGLEAEYASRLSEPPRLAQDALLLSFDTGLMMEVRYLNEREYALHWSWGEAVLRIDTAPVHKECGSYPSHLHRDDGTVEEDKWTRPGDEPWSNFRGLLEALLANPLLEAGGVA